MANLVEFSINITADEATSSDLQKSTLLTIRFHFFAESPIEVSRSCEATLALLCTLQNTSSEAQGPLSTTSLESSFTALLASRPDIADEPWSCAPLLEFLDDGPLPSVLTSSTVVLMKNKIKKLDAANRSAYTRIKDLEGKYASIAEQMQSIQTMLRNQYREQELFKQMRAASSSHSFTNSQDLAPAGAVQGGIELSSESEAEAEDPHAIHALSPLGSFTANAPETLHALALETPASASSGSTDVDAAPHSPPLSSKFNPAAPAFNPSAPAFNPKSAAPPQSPSTKGPTVLPSSTLLSSALYQELPHDEAMQRAAADFIHALCPQQAQVHYRDSVVALIQRNFRSSLNCESLEVGLHRLLCFLPDDPIKVSAVVCRNHSTKWHRIICDRLNMISKKRSDEQGAQEGYTYRSDRPEDEDSASDHVIRNVLISNTKLCIQVQCSVDNTEVELTCNSRAEVCMLAMLEEVNTLVGKNDLFKQSLMLIRAWWCCESAAYVGTTVKNYISDLALCVMICAIFNQHHTQIHTPLQALCAFLAEYSAYDGSTCAISIMGIVPFKSASSNQPVLPAPLNPVLASPPSNGEAASKLLLTREVLEKYWLLYCPPDPANPEQQHSKIMPTLSTSSEDVFGIDLPGIPTVNFSLDVGSSANSVNDSSRDTPSLHEDTTGLSLEDAALSAHRQQCSRNLIKFDRSQFNIVDPFSCNNMVLERPSQNRILRLTKVFQSGATQMSALLTQAQATTENFDARATLKTFFPMSTVRFVDSSARPDTFSVDASFLTPAMITQMTRRIPMSVSVDELARQMRYCNLMVESVISRTAVLDLVVEILTQKGPLPIGEVGKALAELTCITGLSARLKEAYGGLKKFLEDYSNVVIIGSDHPFNPHIVLRSSLSPENLALNDSGVFPTHAVLRMKKVTATSLRKNAFQSKPGIPVAGIPQHQGYRAGGPMTTAGIGMGGQGPDYRGAPQQRPMYPDPRMGVQMQQSHQYGQQQMQPHGAAQQHAYNAKILSNLHADAREREMSGYRPQAPHQPQQQQHAPLQGMHHAGLERHGSGSSQQSHTSHSLSHGSMTGSQSHNSSAGHMYPGDSGMNFVSGNNSVTSGSNDAYEEVIGLGISNSPSASAYNKPYPPNARDQYPPQHGQQHFNAPRPPQFPEQQGMDGLRSRGDSADLLAGAQRGMRGAGPAYPNQHAGAPRQADIMGHAFQQAYPQQGYGGYDRNAPGAPGGITGGSPRDRFASGSPTAAPAFGIDTSFFESSTGNLLNEQYAPLESSRSSGGGSFHVRSGSSGSVGGIGGIGLDRYEPSLNAIPPSAGGNNRNRVGSLLSGLREGTVELSDQGGSREWDLFPPPQQDFLGSGAGGGNDWRPAPQGQADRRY